MTHTWKIHNQKIKALALALIAAVLFAGAAGSGGGCSAPKGMYQGPNDNSPKWR